MTKPGSMARSSPAVTEASGAERAERQRSDYEHLRAERDTVERGGLERG